ncbi:MAG: DUF2520 domain-containing protein [Lentimicrobiaceae bacterium]|nr:DUF2520 domain-containing protein [Lentimicrobiaceae bacterium]
MFTKIAIIGTGNVGTWLHKTLQDQSNLQILSISSRKIETLPKNFDLYIFALKDDIYEVVLQQISFKMPHAAHTSGSLSQNILAPFAEKYGVIYPYQTIKKEKGEKEKGEGKFLLLSEEKVADGDLSPDDGRGDNEGKIPLCIEACDSSFETTLLQWATSMFNIVHKVNEKQRFAMHLAAVFANNFTNAMYDIAYQIFKENNLDWSLIFPLLENTLEKAKRHAPHAVQTGPAVRNDISIMEKHCNALNNKELKDLYLLVSKIIQLK